MTSTTDQTEGAYLFERLINGQDKQSMLRAIVARSQGSVLGELWHAMRTSRQMLAHSRRLREIRPDLSGRPLYEAVVARHCCLAPDLVAQIVTRAKQSFCEWPVERDLRFRDAVHYVVVVDYLRSHPYKVGMRANVETLIARIIPDEL